MTHYSTPWSTPHRCLSRLLGIESSLHLIARVYQLLHIPVALELLYVFRAAEKQGQPLVDLVIAKSGGGRNQL